jgi:hypothetical protein
MNVNDSCYEYVYYGKETWDEMKNETDRGISLYVRDDRGIFLIMYLMIEELSAVRKEMGDLF